MISKRYWRTIFSTNLKCQYPILRNYSAFFRYLPPISRDETPHFYCHFIIKTRIDVTCNKNHVMLTKKKKIKYNDEGYSQRERVSFMLISSFLISCFFLGLYEIIFWVLLN